MNMITLITGANKGLGCETARRLLADGHEVWLAARDPSPGRAAADELRAQVAASKTAEGADPIVAMAKLDPSGPTGTFVDRHGVDAW
jgi:NAD(P)-dependent dehydrogenase (short-subunit alcohol dehydrogenase family)